MTEFWENAFTKHPKMWGEKPTDNAKNVLDLFLKRNIKEVLVPGFGYGRNAKVFYESGIAVRGIEISKTAIKRARKYFGDDVIIHHGSVTDMPFDDAQYEAIYCYSLIHLLDSSERKKLIEDCYTQLKPGGIMVFVALTVKDFRFGVGELVENHTFLSPQGLRLYFYDKAAVNKEFGDYNLVEALEINEPEIHPTEKHWMVVCEKGEV